MSVGRRCGWFVASRPGGSRSRCACRRPRRLAFYEVLTRRTSPRCGSKEVLMRDQVRIMSARRCLPINDTRKQIVNLIMGVDPHKATNTPVALDGNELQLSQIQVRANASQLKRLLTWSASV